MAIKEGWSGDHKGVQNANKMGIVPYGIDLVDRKVTAKETQLIEAMRARTWNL